MSSDELRKLLVQGLSEAAAGTGVEVSVAMSRLQQELFGE